MNTLRTMKYQPELHKITGSITATLLMSQLEYWFEKTNGKPFYKFLAPCEDECYRVGDSWCEEMGFSKDEFRTAFARIGKVYKSKKTYESSEDVFGGKLYASYYDRIRRRTYYLRNQQLVTLYIKEAMTVPQKNVTGGRLQEEVKEEMVTGGRLQEEVKEEMVIEAKTQGEGAEEIATDSVVIHRGSGDVHRCQEIQDDRPRIDSPIKRQSQFPLTEDYTKDLLTQNKTEDDQRAIHQQVLSLYHEICTELPRVIGLTTKRRELLEQLLREGNGSLTTIRTLFMKIKASDFLSGRRADTTWRPTFEWLVDREHSREILNGKYDNWHYPDGQNGKSQSRTEKMDIEKRVRTSRAEITCGVEGERPFIPSTKGTNKFTTTYTHNWDMEALESAAYEHFTML